MVMKLIFVLLVIFIVCMLVGAFFALIFVNIGVFMRKRKIPKDMQEKIQIEKIKLQEVKNVRDKRQTERGSRSFEKPIQADRVERHLKGSGEDEPSTSSDTDRPVRRTKKVKPQFI